MKNEYWEERSVSVFLYLLIGLLCCSRPLVGNSHNPKLTLSEGDLAFVGFNADGDDGFAIVVLSELDGSSGQIEIRFTDNAWDGTSFTTNEGELVWTITSVIEAGTVVIFSNVDGTEQVTVGAVVVNGAMNLSASNENLFAFTGSLSSPTKFISAMSTDGNDGFTTLANTGLTLGVNAIDFDGGTGVDGQRTTDDDILEYKGARNDRASFEAYRLKIYDVTNWKSQDDSGDQSSDMVSPDLPFDNTAFELAINVNLKVFLEGAFSGGSLMNSLNSEIPLAQPYTNNGHMGGVATAIPNTAVDWVLVEVREAVSAENALSNKKVGSAAGFLLSTGEVKGVDGVSSLNISLLGNSGTSFYVVVYHRNHLAIMSANAIAETEGLYTLDLTSSAAETYQSDDALKALSNGKFGLISGDADHDGDVDDDDLSVWRGENGQAFSYGVNSPDFNLDGVVNAIDRNAYWKVNSAAGRTSQVPNME